MFATPIRILKARASSLHNKKTVHMRKSVTMVSEAMIDPDS
jgi:hypothetical protein